MARPGRSALDFLVERGQGDRVRFIILSRYRSGSTLLARTLRQHPWLVVHEEVFNLNNLSRDPELLRAPSSYLRRMFEADHPPQIRAVGFKLMYQQATRAELDRNHWVPGPSAKISSAIDAIEAHIRADRTRYLGDLEAVWEDLRRDPCLRIIHLTRQGYLASYVSFLLAMKEGHWIDSPYETRQVHINPGHCRRWFESCDALSRHYSDLFASHPVLPVSYESLTSRYDSVMRRILEFLDVDPIPLSPATSRQRTQPLRQMIENYDELRRFFDDTEWRTQFQAARD